MVVPLPLQGCVLPPPARAGPPRHSWRCRCAAGVCAPTPRQGRTTLPFGAAAATTPAGGCAQSSRQGWTTWPLYLLNLKVMSSSLIPEKLLCRASTPASVPAYTPHRAWCTMQSYMASLVWLLATRPRYRHMGLKPVYLLLMYELSVQALRKSEAQGASMTAAPDPLLTSNS